VTDAEVFAFAGIWDTWQELLTCAILTTTPNELVAPVHDRMPVILRPEEVDEWLDGDLRDVGRLEAMLQPFPARRMAATPADNALLRA
jgi:putative SOS response-associated peptidase YedK